MPNIADYTPMPTRSYPVGDLDCVAWAYNILVQFANGNILCRDTRNLRICFKIAEFYRGHQDVVGIEISAVMECGCHETVLAWTNTEHFAM